MLDAIRLFLAVAETGSLTKVAKIQAMAVSSVSRKIDALEEELGFRLFHRTSRVILLTDSGEEFLPRANPSCGNWMKQRWQCLRSVLILKVY
ncbi:MAG TPA: LysR family transcriptional regulator [Cellvibrio sp.]|nr:LysR family transcriptional regulator [Cellvibrio sp.]